MAAVDTLSARALPAAFRRNGGSVLAQLLAALDDAWRDAGKPVIPDEYDPEWLTTLAEFLGWGDVLAAAGGVGQAQRPRRLLDLIHLDGAGTEAALVLWVDCLFGLDASVETRREPAGAGEVGPPRATIRLRGAVDAARHPAIVDVLSRLLPAHVAFAAEDVIWDKGEGRMPAEGDSHGPRNLRRPG